MTNNQLIEQDWEKEFDKDFVYLLEKQREEEQEYYEYINRLPGEIIVIHENKLKEHDKRKRRIIESY